MDTGSAVAYVRAVMMSPATTTQSEGGCLEFEYLVNNSDTKPASLAVYAQDLPYTMSGRRLWFTSVIENDGVMVNVPPNMAKFQFAFVATIADPSMSAVAVNKVVYYNDSCLYETPAPCGFRCDDGSCVNETAVCDGTPDCMDETDELPLHCSGEII